MEVSSLDARILEVEGDNLSLKKMIQERKEQESFRPPNEVLHAEIRDLKTKQEEIRSQQASFKHETELHINSWAQVVRGKDKNTPPFTAVEEVVQAKLVKERTRRARELNLKLRGLPLPLPSSDPMEVGVGFLRDTLGISDITLDRAWVGHESTLLDSEMQ